MFFFVCLFCFPSHFVGIFIGPKVCQFFSASFSSCDVIMFSHFAFSLLEGSTPFLSYGIYVFAFICWDQFCCAQVVIFALHFSILFLKHLLPTPSFYRQANQSSERLQAFPMIIQLFRLLATDLELELRFPDTYLVLMMAMIKNHYGL